MKPSTKYLIFMIAVSLAVFLVVIGSFFASWMSLTPDEQIAVEVLFPKLLPFPMLGALFLCVIVGGLVSLLFHYYITPILRLGEETKLISIANPNYRIVTNGAQEIIDLTNIINESAEAFSRLQADVQEQIRSSQTELYEERTRLAALMSELPNGVVVCNIDGRILLYNVQAQRLFNSDIKEQNSIAQPQGLIGLGRSIFSILDRDPIVHALELLNTALGKEQSGPISNFMMTLRDGHYLRVNMAPVFIERQKKRQISGFVLTLEDMTHQIESDTRRDILIQSLTEDLQESLARIRTSISTILSTPEMPRDELDGYRRNIDQASAAIAERVEQARDNYASHLHSLSRQEFVLGENLLEVMANNISERYEMTVKRVADEGQWLMIDSYSAVQAISHLAAMLKAREAIGELEITLEEDSAKVAFLTILWPEKSIDQGLLTEWVNSSLSTKNNDDILTFKNIISKRNGEIRFYPQEGEIASALQITIPPTQHDTPKPLQTSIEHRPISYEFDLFNQQEGWEELSKQPLSKLTFVVFDTETTGLNPSHGDEIIQLGAIRIVNSQLLYDETIDQLVDPQRHVPSESVAIHGIDPQLLVGQPTIDKVLPHFHQFAENSVLVAHNAAFDMRFLQLKEEATGIVFDNPVLDTLLLSSVIHPNQSTHALEGLAERLDVHIVGRHTALGDAIVTAEVLVKMIPLLESNGIKTLEQAFKAQASSPFAKQTY